MNPKYLQVIGVIGAIAGTITACIAVYKFCHKRKRAVPVAGDMNGGWTEARSVAPSASMAPRLVALTYPPPTVAAKDTRVGKGSEAVGLRVTF